jgi:plasmid stabilization system protein ParE
MKVNYTPRARGDIDAILNYIDQRNPQGARNGRPRHAQDH